MNSNHAVLLNQVSDYRAETLAVLDTLSEDMADLIPEGFSNNIRWNLGHILVDQYQWLYFRIADRLPLPASLVELFQYGSSPATWSGPAPSLAELRSLLAGQAEHIRRTFGPRLDEPLLQPTEQGMRTIGQVIPRTLFHEGLHLGTILAMKRLVQRQALVARD